MAADLQWTLFCKLCCFLSLPFFRFPHKVSSSDSKAKSNHKFWQLSSFRSHCPSSRQFDSNLLRGSLPSSPRFFLVTQRAHPDTLMLHFESLAKVRLLKLASCLLFMKFSGSAFLSKRCNGQIVFILPWCNYCCILLFLSGEEALP